MSGVDEVLSQFFKMCSENDTNTKDFYEEMDDFRELQHVLKSDVQLNDSIKHTYNDYLFYNTDKDVKPELLKINQRSIYYYIKNKPEFIKNNVLRYMFKFYYDNKDLKPENLKLDYGLTIEQIKKYYSGVPSSVVIKDKQDLKPFDKTPVFNEIKSIINLINLGSTMKFNVKGFQDNKFMYFIYGLTIAKALNRDFKTFTELLDFILKHLQILPFNKVFKCFCLDNYNLITYITTEGKDNFRYLPALKYKYKERANAKTKYVETDNQKFIYTELSEDEKNNLMTSFNKLYDEKKFNELIITWFDSQFLTRSTCAVGCMLISILLKKIIQFKPDELPDWKAILTGDFNDTYKATDLPQGQDFKNLLTFADNLKICEIFDILATI